jgi:hypothetical protein
MEPTMTLVGTGDAELRIQWANGDVMKVRAYDETVEVYVAGGNASHDALIVRPVSPNVVRLNLAKVGGR